jgi:hypothetical protein
MASTGAPLAVRVVQAVDQVQVARSATARAHREPAGDLRLGRGGERGGLLVPDVHPVDAVRAADRVHDRVQAVAHHAVDPPHTGVSHRTNQLLGNRDHSTKPHRA